MTHRARNVVLGAAAALAALVSLTLLVLLPLSRDASGDLRELVDVAPDGGFTFAGVGVGTPSPPSQPHLLGTIPKLGTFRGDFGTKFFVLGEVEDERVTEMTVVYT